MKATSNEEFFSDGGFNDAAPENRDLGNLELRNDI